MEAQNKIVQVAETVPMYRSNSDGMLNYLIQRI